MKGAQCEQQQEEVGAGVSNHPQHQCFRSFTYLFHLPKTYCCHLIQFHVSPLSTQLSYFILLSLFGYLLLKAFPARSAQSLGDLDVLFTSVSAVTVSSMSTVNMEDFSNSQLVVMTLLILAGGEVFTSMLSLQLRKLRSKPAIRRKRSAVVNSSDLLELGLSTSTVSNPDNDVNINEGEEGSIAYDPTPMSNPAAATTITTLEYEWIRLLGFAVTCYLLLFHSVGFILIQSYMAVVPTARNLLAKKGIRSLTFVVFLTVSSFANCGFVPTNENMMVFKNNSGLLLILIPLLLGGNALYPPCLRVLIRVMRRFMTRKAEEFDAKLRDSMGYDHLLPARHCMWLVATVLGFTMAQLVLFCSMEWDSDGLKGMSSYRKLVGALFQSLNSRHTGESIVDLSTVSPAVVVLYLVMMYLPSYTRFLPTKERDDVTIASESPKDQGEGSKWGRKEVVWRKLVDFSQLSFLSIIVLLICITEGDKMSSDPLNFNVLNIVVEVVSAHGNVGFSMGYSCARRLTPDPTCRDMWYGFVGRWSTKGKLILIIVMLYGRLKKYSMRGGESWRLR